MFYFLYQGKQKVGLRTVMGSFGGTCEIVESNEELDSVQHSRGNKMKGSGLGIDEKVGKLPMLKTGRHFSAENDLNQIFEAIDRRTSARALGISHQSGCSTSKTVSKKPVRVSTSQASGIGISESASLKQALRGLRISHASEMAAMKRLSKPMGSPGVSESGALDRLYKAVVVDSSEGGLPLDDGEGNLVEFSLIPEKSRSNFCDEITECVQSSKVNSTNASAHSSPRLRVGTKKSVIATNTVIQDEIVPASIEVRGKPPLQKLEKKTNLKHGLPPSSSSTTKRVSEIEEIVPASTEFGSKSSILEHGQKGQLHSPRLLSSSKVANKVSKSASNSPRLVRPFVTNASTTRAQSHDEIIFLPASVDMGTSSKVSKSASNSPRIVKPFSVVRVTADKPSQTRTRPQYENVLLTTSLDMGISCNVSKSASNSPRMVKPFSVTRVTRDKPAQTRTHPQYENILLTTSLDMETTCKVSKSASNSPRMPKPFYVSRATTTTKPTTTTTKPTTTRVQPQDESILDSTTGGSGIACKVSKSASNSPRLVKPISGTNTSRSKPTPAKVQKQDDIVLESGEAGKRVANVKLTQKGKVKSGASSSSSNTIKEVLEVEDSDHSPKNFGNKELVTKLEVKGELCLVHLSSGSTAGQVSKSASNSPRVSKPIFRHKSFVKKKVKQDATSLPTSPAVCNGVDNDELLSNKNNLVCRAQSFNQKSVSQEFVSPAASGASMSAEVSSSYVVSGPKKGNHRAGGVKGGERSRLGEKVEFSQSSKSSIGDYSTSTSISEDSSLSGSSSGNRPHMSKDLRWDAIHHVEMRNGTLGLRNFKLLKRLGCGDIGTVYLAELSGTNCLFALKVMDNEYLASRKKMPRAQTEREILQMLDHPFLPTLFAHFTTDKFSCLVMEFCPGGDLHVLRQKQTDRSFSEQAARFYVAEVLLALEYLHMLGVVYRDLKPENILVREDGHIMLSDFDLSLRCTVNPTLLKSSSAIIEPAKKLSGPCAESSCIDPFCLQPTWSQVSCFSPRIISTSARTRKQKADQATQVSPLPQLVAEPTSARSNSFVGTHEYLAPEIIKGEGHGSAVDWWTYGIFLYELLFGKTPFKGSGNEDTLANVVLHSLKFPESPSVSFEARDLIRGLLVKEPDNRLGSVKGATEIKQHPFFEGLNWALIRCAIPPELPKYYDSGETAVVCQQNDAKSTEFTSNGEHLEFELF